MRAAAKRHPGEAVPAPLRLLGEAHWIEGVGIGPNLRHVMGKHRIDPDHSAGRYSVAFEIEIANGASRNGRHRRLQPHRLLESHLGELHGFEIIEARWLIGSEAERGDFVAQPSLPVW